MNRHATCIACNGQEFVGYNYNNHKNTRSWKSAVKSFLPMFDALIPKSSRLKKFSKEIFSGKVLVCRNCGHGKLDRRLSEAQVMRYYQQTYWDDRNMRLEVDSKIDVRAQSQFDFLGGQFPANGSTVNILEIGAGRALSSQLLREKYPNTRIYVCEAGRQFEEYYRGRNIQRIASFFPFHTDIKFNYIHASHWLEHVLDLPATINTLRGMLSDNGMIFIEVPNTAVSYWELPVTDSPHIHFFTPTSLKNSFEKKGFSCLTIGEYGPSFQQMVEGYKFNGTADYFVNDGKGGFLRALFKKV